MILGDKIYMRASVNTNKDLRKIVIISNSTKFMLNNPRTNVHDRVVNVRESDPSKLSISDMDTVDYINGSISNMKKIVKRSLSMKPGSQLALFPFIRTYTNTGNDVAGIVFSEVLEEGIKTIIDLNTSGDSRDYSSYRFLGCFIIDIDSMTALNMPVKDLMHAMEMIKGE